VIKSDLGFSTKFNFSGLTGMQQEGNDKERATLANRIRIKYKDGSEAEMDCG